MAQPAALMCAVLTVMMCASCALARGSYPYGFDHFNMETDYAQAPPQSPARIEVDEMLDGVQWHSVGAPLERPRSAEDLPGCPVTHSACPLSCHFHGVCDEMAGTCACNQGWTGDQCSERTCPESECSIHGDCCSTGCCCHVGWTGARCDEFTGKLPFRGPVCTLNGECSCGDVECRPDILPNLKPVRSRVHPKLEWMEFDECACALDAQCIDAPGVRKLLKFDSYTLNSGAADLFIGSASEYMEEYEWHVCHNHPHFKEWGMFRLRNVETGEVSVGAKSGSTILDSLRLMSGGATSPRYSEHVQGISRGYADWYPYWYDCQWIDVTDLPYGNYVLELEVNPHRRVVESNYDDNIATIDLSCTCEHGQCDFGTCVCDEGWSGVNCDTPATSGGCKPNCEGKSCGPDGCGGTCGSCYRRHHCNDNGQCECSRICYNNECGTDNCGVYDGCGLCMNDYSVCRSGQCVCTGTCRNRECGDNGCGHSCGSCTGEGERCINYQCVSCTPSCPDGAECGDDGCGGFCGFCGEGTECGTEEDGTEHTCVCSPDCANRDCGDDGCGGQCGECDDELTCSDGVCRCLPACTGRQCGPDGCGSFCGSCGESETCSPEGMCVPLSTECGCNGRLCGDDGCGNSCGECLPGSECGPTGHCGPCRTWCVDRECGIDGCGGICGICDAGESCSDEGLCVSNDMGSSVSTPSAMEVSPTSPAVPDDEDCEATCPENSCGGDGCGGVCECQFPNDRCINGECVCIPDCRHKQCGPDGCGAECGLCALNYQCGEDYLCVACEPDCAGKACGSPDGCGGECNDACVSSGDDEDGCSDDCVPICGHRRCGDDGCCGSCGECWEGTTCLDGFCIQPGCAGDCDGKECGDDGCGHSCGACAPSMQCTDFQCVPCEPDCDGKECGSDSCGGTCGECGNGLECLSGTCSCSPDCEGKDCGDDGCGGQCGRCTNPQSVCSDVGECVCVPQCDYKECGEDDGCGRRCGYENPCVPDCNGKVCGPDGCGGICGLCFINEQCTVDGTCLCIPNCEGEECGGADGCGGTCGEAPAVIADDGDPACVPSCGDRVCGDDGCGGTCGHCHHEQDICTSDGRCECMPSCHGKECHESDGCGGRCGARPPCEPPECSPQCTGRECGSDSCGGSCGSCSDGLVCLDEGTCACIPACDGKGCGEGDGCGGICGACNADPECEPSCEGRECGMDGCGGFCGTCRMEQECINDWVCVDTPTKVYYETLKMLFSLEDGRRDEALGRSVQESWKHSVCVAAGIAEVQVEINSWEMYDEQHKVYFSVYVHADDDAAKTTPFDRLSSATGAATLAAAGLREARVERMPPMKTYEDVVASAVPVVSETATPNATDDAAVIGWSTSVVAALLGLNVLTIVVALGGLAYFWMKGRASSSLTQRSPQGWQSAPTSAPGDDDDDDDDEYSL